MASPSPTCTSRSLLYALLQASDVPAVVEAAWAAPRHLNVSLWLLLSLLERPARPPVAPRVDGGEPSDDCIADDGEDNRRSSNTPRWGREVQVWLFLAILLCPVAYLQHSNCHCAVYVLKTL
jgi:hypothetical protein